jgi:hypothetical protein
MRKASAALGWGIFQDNAPLSTPSWQRLKMGGGGALRGIDIAADNTMVTRADVLGAYVFQPGVPSGGNAGGNGFWNQLVTFNSMVGGGALGAGGVYEIRVCHGSSQRLWMVWQGYIWVSTNQGTTFANTSNSLGQFDLNNDTNANANPQSSNGPFMDIDPQNANAVVMGTMSSKGAYITTNGLAGSPTWTQITTGAGGIPAPSGGNGIVIHFDPTSSVVGGFTQGIYAASYGNGVYHSTNGGSTWSLISGSPASVMHLFVDHEGILWATNNTGTNNGTLYKWDGSSWTTPLTASTPNDYNRAFTVAVNPSTSGSSKQIVVGTDYGGTLVSSNNGSTWTGSNSPPSRVATDIPWLQTTSENFMSANNIKFDGNNTLWFAEGIGIWKATSFGNTTTWTSVTAGIENLVGTHVVHGSTLLGPVLAVEDRTYIVSTNQKQYPTIQGVPGNGNSTTDAIVHGWHSDWTPNTSGFVANFNGGVGTGPPNDGSAYSTTGGASWLQFTGVPSSTGQLGGAIAVGNSSNILVCSSNNSNPNITTNGGANWTDLGSYFNTNFGIPASGTTGWGSSFLNNRLTLCAERADATGQTFYIWNDGSGAANTEGIYKTTNAGSSFARTATGLSGGSNRAILQTVPGHSGHLLFSTGDGNLYYSTTGPGGFSAISLMASVTCWGIGAAVSSYPVVIAVCTYNGTVGIFYSTDQLVTWHQIPTYGGQYPSTWIDFIWSIDGDKNTPMRFYALFRQSGAMFYGI